MPSLATWFTSSLKGISRTSGRSAVAAAAYRACTKLHDERTGETHDYTPKAKHGLAENICIGIPNNDISKLWNDAEKADSRKNSRTARELMTPLPCDWTDAQRRECVRDIAQHLRNEYGVAVMASIHRPARKSVNDHGHILFTTRKVDEQGNFGNKTRLLDEGQTNGEIKKLREAVCEIVNNHARANNSDWFVHAGKFSDITDDHIPTKHISIEAGKSQKSRIEANRQEVKEARIAIANTKREVAAIGAKIEALQTQSVLVKSGRNDMPKADKSDVAPLEVPVAKIDLKRVEMPANAIKAKEQIEKSLFSRLTLHQEFAAWEEMHKELLSKPPKPELGIFGWPKARYKKALANHEWEVQAAHDGMAKCTEGANALVEYIQNPVRQKWNDTYNEIVSHNARVEEHEKQIAQQKEREWAQMEREQAQRETSRVDWSASLSESVRDMEARRERASVTECGSGGMGI